MNNVRQWYRRLTFCLLALLMGSLSGCAETGSSVPMDNSVGDLPAMTSSVSNFEDIELPAEMKQDHKNTMSIATDSFRGGIIHYSGNLEVQSLKDFIIVSMKQNKWKLVGEVSTENIILAFTKPNKTCMMNLKNNGIMRDTTVAMYVTVDVAAAKSLNAFGEPIQ